MADGGANSIDPVTVAVTFKVKPGREAEFERWAHEITSASSKYPGHLGASWMRSGAAYHVVYRFADHARFHDWLSRRNVPVSSRDSVPLPRLRKTNT